MKLVLKIMMKIEKKMNLDKVYLIVEAVEKILMMMKMMKIMKIMKIIKLLTHMVLYIMIRFKIRKIQNLTEILMKILVK